MPDRVKEKLSDLLYEASRKADAERYIFDQMADYLITNGVTVLEWISVKDRLPEKSGKYLVCTNRGNVYQTKFYSYPEDKGGHWGQKDKGKSITHWMPCPSRRKENNNANNL